MYDILKESEIKDYRLTFRKNQKLDRFELVIKHMHAGGHFSVHNKVQLLDGHGKFLDMVDISNIDIDQIFSNIEKYGTTEGLYIVKANKDQIVNFSPRRKGITPEDVRHKKTLQESSFTATGEKLNHHWPIFKKYKETGYGSIIRATMTNHQVCMSHCQYCSTIARNKKDSITLDEAKEFVTKLYDDQAEYNKKYFSEYNDLYNQLTGSDIRLKGLILSGGGQPNLWPHFEEFVEWLSGKDISLGLITNGFPKKVSEDIYKHFDWIRISITPEDASPFYPNQKFNLQYIPATVKNNPNITLGLSYVYGPWTNNDIIGRIQSAADDWGVEYVRFLTDCNLTREVQLTAHQALATRLFELGIIEEDGTPTGKIFHQLKYHGTKEEADELWNDGQCFLQTFNVFWDTTGHEDNGHSFCYPCDSVTVLAEAPDDGGSFSERKFNSSVWGTVPNNEVEKLYTEKVHPFFDPRKECKACLFMKNNQTAKSLIDRNDYNLIDLNNNIKHINFP
jgi:organic radical activating enzyme